MYRQELDHCRREIASAKAPATDLLSKMALLDNWLQTANGGYEFAFETPHGIYQRWQSDVTYVWVVKTPDGSLEGPFEEAQDAADWAAEHWDAVFADSEPENS